MGELIFNSTNLLILIIVLAICYIFWAPFIRSRKVKAKVDGYVHPANENNGDIIWALRFVYRPGKNAKNIYCTSKRTFITIKEAQAAFPKGKEVEILLYEPKNGEPEAIIAEDNKDKKQALIYTLYAFGGGIAIAIGYALLVAQAGNAGLR